MLLRLLPLLLCPTLLPPAEAGAPPLPPLTSPYSLGQRFHTLLRLDQAEQAEARHRSRRDLFRFPHNTAFELKWSLNFPVKVEKAYKTTLQAAVPIGARLADLSPDLVKAAPPVPFGTLLPTKGRRRRALESQDRARLYNSLESALEKAGLPGRPCLLRTICEVAEAPLHYGLAGDLLNMALTPSLVGVAAPHSELAPHVEAEEVGAGGADGGCHMRYTECQMSLFDMIPAVKHRILNL